MLKYVKNFIFIIFGSIIAAFGTGSFLLPNLLSTGGFSGIATLLFYLFNISMGGSIIALNIPFFIWSYFKCGKSFVIKTIFSTIIFSYFINFFENKFIITDDSFLASVYGGVLIGLGLALVFKGNSSTGGTDLIANIVKSYNNYITMSSIILVLDIFIVLINMLVLKQIEIGLYSAIAIYFENKIIDFVFEGINFSKIIYIVSDKYEEITSIINIELGKGATQIYAKGAYTNQNKMIIMCVANQRDIIKIKSISKKIDKHSFLIITDARNVYGLGFG